MGNRAEGTGTKATREPSPRAARLRGRASWDHRLHWGLPPMPAYCEVALPVPLDRKFTYAIRDGQRPLRGARVIVPFRNEKLIGIVTALCDVAPTDFEARHLEAVLEEDGEPLLSEHLMKLGEWI